MPATVTTKNYYGELVGKTIKAISFEDDDLGGRDPFPIITFTDGTTAAVQCDSEGNGAGFLCIEQPVKCDQCSKWIAKGEDYYNVKQVCGTETRTVTRCTACVEKKVARCKGRLIMSNHAMNCAWRTSYLPCDCGYRDVRSTIGQRVKRGMIQDVLVTYDKDGKSTVTPTSDWRAITEEDRAKWSKKASAAT